MFENNHPHVKMGDANYHKTSNISRNLVGNQIVDHSYVVGAAPSGACVHVYIIIVDLTGFNRLRKENCKTRQESFNFLEVVRLA